ncbi:TPA: leucine--tRNA ligase [Candidatus Micrarchaeota archaeon]|nr:leucine--tRNA ligase [Candidatus Micrarchaeota archaeon]
MDFNSIERKWQERWEQEKAFEPSVAQGKEKFFFTVPYPYVSGNLHVGHGRTYAIGDVIVRFKRMRNFNVLWPMAFHITGTPVLAVSQKIKARDEAAWQMYREYVGIYETDPSRVEEIVRSFEDPWNVVNYFSKKIVSDFAKMGFSLDFSRQFTTGDVEYNKFVEWQFFKYRERGYLAQGTYPVLFDLQEKNAVGEDDIKDGDTDPVELKKFIALKSRFSFDGGSGFIISSTLRPETVFGITNVFVNPRAQYVKVKVGGEILFMSREAAEKLSFQHHEVKIEGEFPGEFFVGKIVETPLQQAVPILPADFVDANNASGFVHSVPAHSVADWLALEELRKDEKTLAKYEQQKLRSLVNSIKPVSLIKLEGFGEFPAKEMAERMKIANTREKQKLDKATQHLYKAEFYGGIMKGNCLGFEGKTVAEAKDEVAQWLLRDNNAFWFYEASRPAFSRAGGKVISAVLPDQWFLDFNAKGWKENAFECLREMGIFPQAYRKQFEDVFNWLDKRPCARRRGLGTRLPFNRDWIIESLSDSTLYMAFYTVAKKIHEHKIRPEFLDENFFDFVFLAKPYRGALSTKIMNEIRTEFAYWYPNDQRHTAVAHVTNHLSFFIFAHAGIFEKRFWPKAITLNEMVLSEGQKMSKSKGNVVLLNNIARDYGADLFRLYAVGTADFGSTLDFRKKDIDALRRNLNKFFDYVGEYISRAGKGGKKTTLTRWFESKIESSIKQSTEFLEKFALRGYVQSAFFRNLKALDYFHKRASEEEKSAVRKSIARWVQLLSPLAPHLCEELWEKSGGKGLCSLSAWPEAQEDKINLEAEATQDFIASVLEDARKILDVIGGKQKIAHLKLIVASASKNSFVQKLVEEGKSAEKALLPIVEDELTKRYLDKMYFEIVSNPQMLFVEEGRALKEAKDFLEKELGLKVSVESEEESKEEKAARAMPLKPALVFS